EPEHPVARVGQQRPRVVLPGCLLALPEPDALPEQALRFGRPDRGDDADAQAVAGRLVGRPLQRVPAGVRAVHADHDPVRSGNGTHLACLALHRASPASRAALPPGGAAVQGHTPRRTAAGTAAESRPSRPPVAPARPRPFSPGPPCPLTVISPGWASIAPMTSSSRVLIADDDRAIRESLERALQREGYDVLTAEDGVQAIATVHGGPVDLLILDVMMP